MVRFGRRPPILWTGRGLKDRSLLWCKNLDDVVYVAEIVSRMFSCFLTMHHLLKLVGTVIDTLTSVTRKVELGCVLRTPCRVMRHCKFPAR